MAFAGETLASASGLRPLSAFVVVGAVVAAVVVQVARIAAAGDGIRRDRERVEDGWRPSYDLEDREGRLLARFVSRYELELSPRAMWQAHTPDRMARVVSHALGGAPPPSELLAELLPDARPGEHGGLEIEVAAWDLTALEAERVAAWIERGGEPAGAEPGPPLAGVRLVRLSGRLPQAPGEPPPPWGERLAYRIVWEPALLLSAEERERHDYPAERPVRWSRHLARGLFACLAPRLRPALEELRADRPRAGDSELVADVVWTALVPTAFRRLPVEIGPEEERALSAALEAEGVNALQMRVAVARERQYPIGRHELVGDWGFRGPEDTDRHPRGGLEALGEDVLELLAAPAPDGSRYAYLHNRPGGRERVRRAYFLSSAGAEAPPVVRVTLDLGVQRELRSQLEATLEEHGAVSAQGIVVELESGDVLAVDGVHGYGLSGFLPTYYQFTPGSTYKLVTMATALEAGVVRPDETFDVGDDPWPVPGSSRRIHEAEGTRHGLLTAAECVAYSSNRGMVQVGLRIPQDFFWTAMQALGYGRAPETGLGPASPGHVRPPEWRLAWDQASFCFGHQILTTLWQHAAGLAAIARGGEWRPLRLVNAVELGGETIPWPREAGTRVFSERTCAQVRSMMDLGAREGTGRSLFREDLRLGTKTGTAEKVPSELCGHREVRAILEAGRAPTAAERRALARLGPTHRGRCYTSSICVVGGLPGEERELLVLVVVEEPVKNGKYGGKVAGPAAMAVLDEALGLTRGGRLPVPAVLGGFAPSAAPSDPGAGAPEAHRPDGLETFVAQPWQARLGGDAP